MIWNCVHQTSCKEDDGVDKPNNPLIFSNAVNSKLLREGQIGTVGTCLIPSLSCGSDGAQADGIPQHGRAMPLVISFVDEGAALRILEHRKHFKPLWVPRHKSSAAEKLGMFCHVV